MNQDFIEKQTMSWTKISSNKFSKPTEDHQKRIENSIFEDFRLNLKPENIFNRIDKNVVCSTHEQLINRERERDSKHSMFNIPLVMIFILN